MLIYNLQYKKKDIYIYIYKLYKNKEKRYLRKKNKSYVYNFSLLTSNHSFICTSVPLCCSLRYGLFIKLSMIFSSLILELFSSLLMEYSNLSVRDIVIIHDPDLDSCARSCKTCKLHSKSDQV